jgi:hypothetical protein
VDSDELAKLLAGLCRRDIKSELPRPQMDMWQSSASIGIGRVAASVDSIGE